MESISRISSLLETARDLTLEAASTASQVSTSRPSNLTKPLPAAQIKKLLDSRHERDVLDGLRRVIAMQYSRDTLPTSTLTFFPAVLKTLSNPYPSTRPLVYCYLLHHAEADPDTALLAINTIQKSLSDPNPRVRALALKTMSGIRVPVISQIVSLAIKKGCSDLSPLVRKAAALACVKCVRLDPTARPQVEEYIAQLLGDKEYYVTGAAVQAFVEICGLERVEMVHPVYRRLCRMVVDMDEWGQLAVLKLLTGYARRCFPKRRKRVKKTRTQEERARDFYDDLEPKEEKNDQDDYEEVEVMDPDLELFLTSIQPLLHSRNSAVIIAVTRAYLYLSPTTHLSHAIGPLVALLRSPQDIQQVALTNIVQVCLRHPEFFTSYIRHFLLKPSSDAPATWNLKLEILTLLFPHSTTEIQDLILAELEHFSHAHSNTDLIRASVKAIGRCAQSSSPQTSRRCLSLLLKQIHSPDQHLVAEAMEVIRHLIQRSPDEHRKTVVRLAKNLDTLTSPTARASVVWLVGEFAGIEPERNIAADVLRILVKGYADESEEVRGQIVLLAAKVYLHYLNSKNAKQKALDALNTPPSSTKTDSNDLDPEAEQPWSAPAPQEQPPLDETHVIERLYTQTQLLARYTPSYTLRDRARTYRALLSVPSSTELASLLLLAPKPVPKAPSPSEARQNFTLGSASLAIGEGAAIDDGLPEWVKEGEEPDPRLREEGDGGGVSSGVKGAGAVSAGQRLEEALAAETREKGKGVAGGAGGKEKSLDDWLDEESESEEESEEGETETESETEEEGEEESEEEEEDDDEDASQSTEEYTGQY